MNINVTSLKGLRSQNEDQHDIIINRNGELSKKMNRVNVYAIYDGHGGKNVSKYLKENLGKKFLNASMDIPLKKTSVIKEYDNIQGQLKTKHFSQHVGSTSLVVVHYTVNNKNYINVINTGDSRCVVCRENFGISLTKDHKPNWPEEKNRIEKLGGKITFDGHDYRIKDLSVSRAFGDFDTVPYVTHRPDIFKYELGRGDKFIVLACDGLWDVMSNQDVVNFILLYSYDSEMKERKNKNINIAKKLGEYAIQVMKSTDNITIIIIYLS